MYFELRKNRQAKEYLDKAVDVSLAIGDRKLEAYATAGLAAVFASVNDYQKTKEHCEKALTISRECGNRKFEAEIYLNLGNLYLSLGESGKAEDYLEKACSISSQFGYKMTHFQSLLGITQLKISQSEVVEANQCLLQCIGKYEQIRTFLKGNSEFKMSLLDFPTSYSLTCYAVLENFEMLFMLRNWYEQESSLNSWQISTPWKATSQLIHNHGSGLKTS